MNIAKKEAVQAQFKDVYNIEIKKVRKCDLNYDDLVFPSKINIKQIQLRRKKAKSNHQIICNQKEKYVIYCPEEKVKQYANIIKNSNMEQMAVIPKQQKKHIKQYSFGKIVTLIFVGLIVGFVNGFFGGGGGMICVPLLIFCLGLKDKESHATAILVMLSISIVSIIIYLTNFEINYDISLYVVLGSIVGGIIGSLLLKRLSNLWIRIIFAFIMIFAGINIIF